MLLTVWMCILVPAISMAEGGFFRAIDAMGQNPFSWLSDQKKEKRGMDAVNQLRVLGFDMRDSILDEIKEKEIQMLQSLVEGKEVDETWQQMIDSAIQQVETDIQNANVYDILMKLGMGKMDYQTGEWTPLSNQVYAFDAEVMFIDLMYTQFLQGVQAIVRDIGITCIQEDLSGMTAEMTFADDPQAMPEDGRRKVSFLCNGHPYSIELESYGDWFNQRMIDFMNQVLEKENCENRLHILTDKYDQMVIMIYDTTERAEAIRPFLSAPWKEEYSW